MFTRKSKWKKIHKIDKQILKINQKHLQHKHKNFKN
jgi:hypothetical protein